MRRSCLVLLAALVGCQSVPVHSAPYGADVFVDGEKVGRTPCKFKASTIIGSDYTVEVRLPGHKPYVEVVESEWGPGATWNLLSSIVFLSPLIILTPFFGDVVPGAVFAPLEPAGPDGRSAATPPPSTLARPDEEVH